MQLPAGEVAVSWKKEADTICFQITVPENTRATFVYGSAEYLLTQPNSEFTFVTA